MVNNKSDSPQSFISDNLWLFWVVGFIGCTWEFIFFDVDDEWMVKYEYNESNFTVDLFFEELSNEG